jgi:hypothetical protein
MMASPNEQNSKTQDVAKQVAEAHSLLLTLRERLDKHPELEDAIRRLEIALEQLTLQTGGML